MKRRPMWMSAAPARLWLAAGLLGLSLSAQAALFGDDEARRAIIDLRQRFEQLQKRNNDDLVRTQDALAAANDALRKSNESLGRLGEENAQLRRSVLDLANQIEQLRAELSRMTGQNEQLAREVSEVQRRLKDVTTGVEDRLRRFEPTQVVVDGREFMAEPAEIRDYEAALAILRRGEFAAAQAAFAAFLQRNPGSGYKPSALFWLGSAQYANRNPKEALVSLRAMLAEAPAHPRASEAMLAVANAQLELKEPRPAVRKTLEDLVKAHPQSEAAGVARDLLSKLK